MAFLDFASSIALQWTGVGTFFNSSFVSAFLSALAGAGLGVWGAQTLAERSVRARELLDALRQANAIIVIAATIANQALSIKNQYVKPMADRYFEDRKLAMVCIEQKSDGENLRLPRFQLQLTKMTPLTLPVEALKGLAFSAHLMPGKALATVSMIEQAVTELTHAVAIRSELIDALHSAQSDRRAQFEDYFGLRHQDGNTNSMYHDTMVAVSQYTNDVAFFGAELVDELQVHATRVRTKLFKMRRDVPEANTVDFSAVRKSGLMPPKEDYQSWLRGFSTRDSGRN